MLYADAGPRRMKLGYLVPDWPGQTHAFFWREVRALRAAGHEVILFSTRRPPLDASGHAFAAGAHDETHYLYPPRKHGLARTVVRHPIGMLGAIGHVVGLAEASARQKIRLLGMGVCAADLVTWVRTMRIDHLHVHSCADSAHLAAMALQIGGCGYSLTLHGDLPVYGGDHAAKMRDAAFVATVTRQLRDQVVAATGLDPSRVPVIAMGVDTDLFAPAPRPTGPFQLLTVARLAHTKGHVLTLDAIARLRTEGLDIRYTIAGEGDSRGAIVARTGELGLGAVVTMTGSVGEDEALRLLQQADAFVLSSFGPGEAAPVSVMEAMSCGLPVICSRIGGTGDMIEHGISGMLVRQEDVAGLADAIALLAQDRQLCARLGGAARARAVERFDYRLAAGALAGAIMAAVGSHVGFRRPYPPRDGMAEASPDDAGPGKILRLATAAVDRSRS